MKQTHRIIIDEISDLLNAHPELRFGQALHALGINEFADKDDPGSKDHLLRDIFHDSNATIIRRIDNIKK